MMDDTQRLDYNDDEEEPSANRDRPMGNLHMFAGIHGGTQDFPIYRGQNIIGRHANCDITLPAQSVSKKHAILEVRGDCHTICDNNSLNKTRRGKTALAPNVHYALSDGDFLLFADVACRYTIVKVQAEATEVEDSEDDSVLVPATQGALAIEKTPGAAIRRIARGIVLARDSGDEENEEEEEGQTRWHEGGSGSVRDGHKTSGSGTTFPPDADTIVPESDEENDTSTSEMPLPSLSLRCDSDTDTSRRSSFVPSSQSISTPLPKSKHDGRTAVDKEEMIPRKPEDGEIKTSSAVEENQEEQKASTSGGSVSQPEVGIVSTVESERMLQHKALKEPCSESKPASSPCVEVDNVALNRSENVQETPSELKPNVDVKVDHVSLDSAANIQEDTTTSGSDVNTAETSEIQTNKSKEEGDSRSSGSREAAFHMDSDTDEDEAESDLEKSKSLQVAYIEKSEKNASVPVTCRKEGDSDSDTDVEDDQNVKKSKSDNDEAKRTMGEPIKTEGTPGLSLDSDTDDDDDADEPKPLENKADQDSRSNTDEKKEGFHMDSDTDVEEEVFTAEVKEAKPEPLKTSAKETKGVLNLDSDTDVDEEDNVSSRHMTHGLQDSSTASTNVQDATGVESDTNVDEDEQIPGGAKDNTDVVEAKEALHVGSDTDDDNDDRLPVVPPLEKVRAPEVSTDSAVKDTEIAKEPADLHLDSDTDVEESDARAEEDEMDTTGSQEEADQKTSVSSVNEIAAVSGSSAEETKNIPTEVSMDEDETQKSDSESVDLEMMPTQCYLEPEAESELPDEEEEEATQAYIFSSTWAEPNPFKSPADPIGVLQISSVTSVNTSEEEIDENALAETQAFCTEAERVGPSVQETPELVERSLDESMQSTTSEKESGKEVQQLSHQTMSPDATQPVSQCLSSRQSEETGTWMHLKREVPASVWIRGIQQGGDSTDLEGGSDATQAEDQSLNLELEATQIYGVESPSEQKPLAHTEIQLVPAAGEDKETPTMPAAGEDKETPTVPAAGEDKETPTVPAAGEDKETPTVPAAGEDKETPTVPAAGEDKETPTVPAAGEDKETPTVPAAGEDKETPTVPAAGEDKETPTVPAAGEDKETPTVPAAGEDKETPTVPAAGEDKETPTVPAAGEDKETPTVPAAGEDKETPTVPAAGENKETPTVPAAGEDKETPTVPAAGEDKETPTVPAAGENKETPTVPAAGENKETPTVPAAGEDKETPTVPTADKDYKEPNVPAETTEQPLSDDIQASDNDATQAYSLDVPGSGSGTQACVLSDETTSDATQATNVYTVATEDNAQVAGPSVPNAEEVVPEKSTESKKKLPLRKGLSRSKKKVESAKNVPQTSSEIEECPGKDPVGPGSLKEEPGEQGAGEPQLSEPGIQEVQVERGLRRGGRRIAESQTKTTVKEEIHVATTSRKTTSKTSDDEPSASGINEKRGRRQVSRKTAVKVVDEVYKEEHKQSSSNTEEAKEGSAPEILPINSPEEIESLNAEDHQKGNTAEQTSKESSDQSSLENKDILSTEAFTSSAVSESNNPMESNDNSADKESDSRDTNVNEKPGRNKRRVATRLESEAADKTEFTDNLEKEKDESRGRCNVRTTRKTDTSKQSSESPQSQQITQEQSQGRKATRKSRTKPSGPQSDKVEDTTISVTDENKKVDEICPADSVSGNEKPRRTRRSLKEEIEEESENLQDRDKKGKNVRSASVKDAEPRTKDKEQGNLEDLAASNKISRRTRNNPKGETTKPEQVKEENEVVKKSRRTQKNLKEEQKTEDNTETQGTSSSETPTSRRTRKENREEDSVVKEETVKETTPRRTRRHSKEDSIKLEDDQTKRSRRTRRDSKEEAKTQESVEESVLEENKEETVGRKTTRKTRKNVKDDEKTILHEESKQTEDNSKSERSSRTRVKASDENRELHEEGVNKGVEESQKLSPHKEKSKPAVGRGRRAAKKEDTPEVSTPVASRKRGQAAKAEVEIKRKKSDEGEEQEKLEVVETPKRGRPRKLVTQTESPRAGKEISTPDPSPSRSTRQRSSSALSNPPEAITPRRTNRMSTSTTSPYVAQSGSAPKILFTGVVDTAGEETIRSLGAEIAESVFDCTHLVTDRVRRTVKFLCALARGIPIVTLDWIDKCKKSGCFLSPTGFLVNDKEQEKNFSFTLSESLQKAKRRPLLEGYEIHVTANVKPEPDHMKDIIRCSGATFLSKMPRSFKDKCVVVSCPEDAARCKSVPASVPITSAEFILSGILRQEVNPTAHLLNPAVQDSGPPPAKRRR
ncbi:mediator of DNA damage checkpoint protein 1 isoform X2 [Bufo bufo]|uniref:mediator of DNA damage checkpoint protein 1 isoform X2 n=1 Tax=Bufo bufo TaxID=8384 RepID=UPI001ABE39E3|nr:mediator of DNA damage checkpoint protein 1 isoform X2 [Bufo bufo]